jgi:hypothetical protein
MKIIESIRIKYYRSILNTTRGNQTHLSTSDLNVIVGSNDAGKSNYLRALNLFFNNCSDPDVPFSFWDDFSNQRHGIRREENRIESELIINPPKSQNFQNNGKIKWLKVWREGTSNPEEKFEYLNGSNFTANYRSSYYKWLKKIKFRYVPAIKSERYFSNLMLDLYDVLQKDTEGIERDFNKQVGEQTAKISDQIGSRLGIESVLQFKGSFRNLFNSLEFGSNDGKLMLSKRGDGIKVRHIPIILQNIAEAELKENRFREPIASTIWGFEEPENNLEFDSAKKLSESFIEYIMKIHFNNEDYSRYDEGIQIFLTTHSPIFYTLSNQNSPNISSFYVKKQDDDSSNIRQITNEQNIILETEMKLLPLFELSKHWAQINDTIKDLSQNKIELEKQLESFSEIKKCIFLTEDKKQNLVEVLLKSNGFDIENIDLRSYKGCTNLGSTEVLFKYLKDKFNLDCPHIIVHRDKDYMTDEEVESEKMKYNKIGIDLFITQGTDIESYFVRIEHLKKCYPDYNETDLIQILRQAKDDKKEFSINMVKSKEFGEKHKSKSSHLQNSIIDFYDSKEDTLFHGKEVYRKVKSLIQEKYRHNALIDIESEALFDVNLAEISRRLMNQTSTRLACATSG